MRHTLLVILLSIGLLDTGVCGQSLMEHAAAAAGGSVGGVAGKKVSDGVSAIFGNVDKQTKKAADANKSDALFEVGPGVPKPEQGFVPPPPPPVHRASVAKAAPVAPEPPPAPLPPPAPIAPPPPPVTAEELKTIAVGTNRTDLLKLGQPASRITMFDDGHLVEVFHYASHDMTVGVIRLTDGAVSCVQAR